MQRAKTLGISSGIVSFNPHPITIVTNEHKFNYIQPLSERINELKKTGIDFISIIEFTNELSQLSAIEFLKFLKQKINYKLLIVGNGFTIGKDREGDLSELKRIAEELDFQVIEVPLKKDSINFFSSSMIRKYLLSGQISHANKILGRHFMISGICQKGDQRGRMLGFPTINIHLPNNHILPKKGVYYTKTLLGNEYFFSITNVGTRPTFDKDEILVESHLFDYNKDAYDKKTEIFFYEFIRGEIKFSSEQELIEQINADIIIAKKNIIKE
jgi:riboflavin kinase/FMN adenylyltransferase